MSLGRAKSRHKIGRSQLYKFSFASLQGLNLWDSSHSMENLLVFLGLWTFKLPRSKRMLFFDKEMGHKGVSRPHLVAPQNLNLIRYCQFWLIFLKEHFLMQPTAEIKGSM